MSKTLIPFEEIPAVPADHPAWTDDPNQSPEDGVKLVLASTMVTYAMDDDVDLDVDVMSHTKHPFLLWVRKQQIQNKEQ